MTLIATYKLNVRTLNVHSNTILNSPLIKFGHFNIYYKNVFSVRWKLNIEIGMVGKKRCDVQMYYIVYNKYNIQYILYYI